MVNTNVFPNVIYFANDCIQSIQINRGPHCLRTRGSGATLQGLMTESKAKPPRASQGGAFESRGRFYMRVTVAPGQRPAKLVPDATLEGAAARAHATQALVNRLRGAGQTDFVENVVKSAATADAAKMTKLASFVDDVLGGAVVVKPSSAKPAADTVRGIGERWTTGELHALHPDHVREKRSAKDDEYRLDILCATGIGDVPLAKLTLDQIDAAMRGLDAARVKRAKGRTVGRGPRKAKPLDAGGRRQYAQMLARICAMGVYPLKLIAVSPIPKGWLPRVPNDKAKGLVYPDEEQTFLADAAHPLQWRLFFGALARLGFRADEAASLTIADVDIKRGIVTLDVTKTDDPRAPTYADVPGLLPALKWYRSTYRAKAKADASFFVQPNGERIRVDGLAERYRTMLEATLRRADMYRPELFVGGDRRMKVRVHDLRGAFVTYGLANGRTETWVMDRTGHRSSQMVNRYRRVARTVAEADLGDLTPLNEAVPEIAAANLAANAAAKPNLLDERRDVTNQNDVSSGLIAQSVELRTFNWQSPITLEDSREVTDAVEDARRPSTPLLPRSAAAKDQNAAADVYGACIDPVDAALAAGISAVASAMTTATPGEIVTLADRMTVLARELEARRLARGSNVVDLATRRR